MKQERKPEKKKLAAMKHEVLGNPKSFVAFNSKSQNIYFRKIGGLASTWQQCGD